MRAKTLLPLLLCVALIMVGAPVDGAAGKKPKPDPYRFKMVKEIAHTPVKNQYRTGTCWCFATVSFLESETLRLGGPELDLSEMYVVRHTYPRKAENYIRLHGNANFEQGGQGHDVLEQVARFGIVPEADYTGMCINEKRHNHGEMVSVLKGMVDGVLKRRGQRITPRWLEAVAAVLDTYLGVPPQEVSHEGVSLTPLEFARDVARIVPEDYVEFTSYIHHPFWTRMRLEIPDNWTYNADYCNLPMNDMLRLINHALENGFSVAWDGDVSERFFSSRETGLGLVPVKDWEDMTRKEQQRELTAPIEEKEVTQEMRQETFENFTTTDDHLMHIVGLARDQRGNPFYYTKNSGGTVDRKFGGYLYMSEPYVKLKTICVMVHKDAVPADIRERFGL
ncbi:MAG: C1 family peptidase [Acidobacteriota bacterium]|jgi:bleomycin hydrolase|nr:C1 family peptidase [Acidobacteriota bacterium]